MYNMILKQIPAQSTLEFYIIITSILNVTQSFDCHATCRSINEII